MEHATYLRQLFPTLTLFGVMVFSGASCTKTSKTNVVQANDRKCPSRPLSKIDGKNGEEKSDKDQNEEGGSGRPQGSTPNPPVASPQEEGGSGRSQGSTPNPPVASPPVVEPNNPAGVAVPQRDACVNQLFDALDSKEFKEKVSPEEIEAMKTFIITGYNIADEFASSGESAIEYCDKILKNLEEAAK